MSAQKVCTALLLVVSAAAAHAQVQPLSEDAALARLSPDSPRVRALAGEVDVARADIAMARRFPNPQLAVSREAAGGVREYYSLVTQALPVTGRRGFEIRASEARLRATDARFDALLWRARADLRQAYAELAVSQAREDELRRVRDRLSELADTLARREAAGDAAGFDRLRAEREVLDVEADLAATVAARGRAQAALAAFFPPDVDPLALRVEPIGASSPAALPDLDVLVTRAIASRGELRALDADADAARFAGRAAARRRIPEPQVTAGLKTVGGGPDRQGSVLTVQASVPLFDAGKAERLQARSRESLAVAQAEAFRTSLRAEIAGLRAAIAERRRAVARYGPARASADALERIARVSYDDGERGILEVLDAYRSAATARLRALDLTLAQRLDEIELEYLAGWELPR